MTIQLIALTFLWGVGSLFLVAVKTNSLKSVFLKNPSIVTGDFFVLPAVAGIIGNSINSFADLFAGFSVLLILLVSLLLMIVSALRNKLVHTLWIPHLLFYWFMAFIILSYLSKFQFDTLWWFVLIGAIFHQSLGILFPKKFSDEDVYEK